MARPADRGRWTSSDHTAMINTGRDWTLRQLGTLPKELDPKVFADYLLTLGMKTRVDERPDGGRLWIYNEDHLERAREELSGYLERAR